MLQRRALLVVFVLTVSVLMCLTASASELTQEIVIETRDTDLPIDIAAIRRAEQVDIMLSLRFFDLGLFSSDSQAVHEAMARQRHLNFASLGSDLFETFEVLRETDLSHQTAYTASALELFSNPVTVRSLGQASTEDGIPTLAVAGVLAVFTALGFVLARMIIGKRSADKNTDS